MWEDLKITPPKRQKQKKIQKSFKLKLKNLLIILESMRALQLGARSLAMRRAAGFAIDKSSTFSRMSAYRNDFDEQIKQKYIRNQVKD